MISFRCGSCGQQMAAESGGGGQTFCPRCGALVNVPAEAPKAAAPAAAMRPELPAPPLPAGTGAAVALALLAGGLLPVGLSMPLLTWGPLAADARLPVTAYPSPGPQGGSITGFDVVSLGPPALALAVTALAVGVTGRAPVVVFGLGWGLAAFLLAHLVRANQVGYELGRALKGGRPVLTPEWPAWAVLFAAAACLVASGAAGLRAASRREGEAPAEPSQGGSAGASPSPPAALMPASAPSPPAPPGT
jgi:hypothetical protein